MKHLQPGSKLYQAIEGPFSKLVKRSRWPLTCEKQQIKNVWLQFDIVPLKSKQSRASEGDNQAHFLQIKKLDPSCKHLNTRHPLQLMLVVRVSRDLGILWQAEGAVCMCSRQYYPGILEYSDKGVQYACVHASTILGSWDTLTRGCSMHVFMPVLS